MTDKNPDKNSKVTINYRGMLLQAERVDYITVDDDSAVLQLFMPSENRVLVFRISDIKIFKIPFQSISGEPFSFHVEWANSVEILEK